MSAKTIHIFSLGAPAEAHVRAFIADGQQEQGEGCKLIATEVILAEYIWTGMLKHTLRITMDAAEWPRVKAEMDGVGYDYEEVNGDA